MIIYPYSFQTEVFEKQIYERTRSIDDYVPIVFPDWSICETKNITEKYSSSFAEYRYSYACDFFISLYDAPNCILTNQIKNYDLQTLCPLSPPPNIYGIPLSSYPGGYKEMSSILADQ